MKGKGILLLSFFMLGFYISQAQSDIPIGTWRVHNSFNAIQAITLSEEYIYAAGSNGVMMLDRSDNSITTISKLNGLYASLITDIYYDEPSKQLLIAYEEGKFDVVKGTVKNFDPTRTSVIAASKKVNDIFVHSKLAYLSTDYGVLVFDLNRSEIKETWRDIGFNGTTLAIYNSTVLGDSIFLATENGILIGNLNDNLLDYGKWKRFNTGVFDTAIKAVTVFNNTVYAIIDEDGIYRYENGIWHKEEFLAGLQYKSMDASNNHLIIVENSNIWLLDMNGNLNAITNSAIAVPLVAEEDELGRLWIGDNTNGLLLYSSGTVNSYLANGPATSNGVKLRHHNLKLYLLPGGHTDEFLPLNRNGIISVFENGRWSTHQETIPDLMDVEITSSGKIFYGSFGYGAKETDPQGNTIIYDETNSSLVNVNPPGRFVNITALQNSAQGVWVTNYGANTSLHRVSLENNWEPFAFPLSAAKYPTSLTIDFNQKVWMVLNPIHGGGIIVYNPTDDTYQYLTDQDNNGELPDRAVYAIATDREGYVWVGTDRGAAYFFNSSSDAVRPIIENMYLLLDDRVTAIAVDGGNRKWLGTQRGVWLVNSTGDESIHHFTTSNSPLPSDHIMDIEIHPETGEVFFLTDKGLVSYRSNATEGSSQSGSVKIFPNPVTGNYSGEVGISGLETDAIVKITDVSGKLIWHQQANGGATSWNVLDYKGRRMSSGVYLVFATNQDSSETMVGKIVVVK